MLEKSMTASPLSALRPILAAALLPLGLL